MSELDPDAKDRRIIELQAENKCLLDALADVVGNQLGRGGSFSCFRGPAGEERTEEILLLLLRAGRVVPAHDRVWRIAIPPEDVAAVRAAGGFLTLDEWKAARAPK